MKKVRLNICFKDRVYVERLHGYLRSRLGRPAEIGDFLDAAHLQKERMRDRCDVLILEEEEASKCDLSAFGRILLLTEADEPYEEVTEHQHILTLSRYRRASEIADAVRSLIGEDDMTDTGEGEKNRAKIVGYYSPLGRCMQTSMAIASGQMISEKARALFLNFSAFAPEEISDREGNLADLVYYHGCERDHFSTWLSRLKKQTGGLSYIPAAQALCQTEGIGAEEWISLIHTVASSGTTDVLLLDLSSGVPGLFEILAVCDEIYTITGCDARDHKKIASYKRWLVMNEEEEILKKTRFCTLPQACPLPEKSSALKCGQLAQHLWQNRLIPEVPCA